MKNVLVLLFFLITTLSFAEDVPVEAGVLENANPCDVEELEHKPVYCLFVGDILAAMVQHLEDAKEIPDEFVPISDYREFYRTFQVVSKQRCDSIWYKQAIKNKPLQDYWDALCNPPNPPDWPPSLIMWGWEGGGGIIGLIW